VKRVRSPGHRPPRAQGPLYGTHEDFGLPDPQGPDSEEDDSELDPTGEPWDPADLDEDDEEPEPEYGDFRLEPDDFED
jgi:hypothetical protein